MNAMGTIKRQFEGIWCLVFSLDFNTFVKVFVTHFPYSVVAIGSIRYTIVDCGVEVAHTVVLMEELLSSVLRGESNECFP